MSQNSYYWVRADKAPADKSFPQRNPEPKADRRSLTQRDKLTLGMFGFFLVLVLAGVVGRDSSSSDQAAWEKFLSYPADVQSDMIRICGSVDRLGPRADLPEARNETERQIRNTILVCSMLKRRGAY